MKELINIKDYESAKVLTEMHDTLKAGVPELRPSGSGGYFEFAGDFQHRLGGEDKEESLAQKHQKALLEKIKEEYDTIITKASEELLAVGVKLVDERKSLIEADINRLGYKLD